MRGGGVPLLPLPNANGRCLNGVRPSGPSVFYGVDISSVDFGGPERHIERARPANAGATKTSLPGARKGQDDNIEGVIQWLELAPTCNHGGYQTVLRSSEARPPGTGFNADSIVNQPSGRC